MKKILIFIDHDIMIRHFILSGALKGLEKVYDVIYVFPERDTRIKIDVNSLTLPSVRFLPVSRARTSKLTQLAQIKTIQRSWFNPTFKQIRLAYQGVFDRRTYQKMVLLSLPLLYSVFRRKVLRAMPPFTELADLIAETRPAVILHPTVLHGLFISDLAAASKKANIPFVALMNSWDNPSTKAQVIRNPDWLAVWGEQTCQHAVEFMRFPRERIEILGAAQFDIYSRPAEKGRSEVAAGLDADPSLLLILYAGSSKGIDEMEQLLALDAAITQGDLPPAKIIFRPHPWRDPSHETLDFFEISWRNVVMDPSMKENYIGPKSKGEAIIHITDYADTHTILSACDLLIGNVSTILLEAAMHGKPVISFFNERDAQNRTSHFSAVLNQRYFRELLSGLEIPLCRSIDEVILHARSLLALSRDETFSARQRKASRYFADQDGRTYAERLLGFLKVVESSHRDHIE